MPVFFCLILSRQNIFHPSLIYTYPEIGDQKVSQASDYTYEMCIHLPI